LTPHAFAFATIAGARINIITTYAEL